MKIIKFGVLPSIFLAGAAMLGGCVGLEPDASTDEWTTEPGEAVETDLEASHPPVQPVTALSPPHAPVRKGYTWNAVRKRMELVHYAEVDGLAVVEGDMIIGTVEEVEARTREVEARSAPQEGGVQVQGIAVEGGPVRWPNGVVPYTIDPTLPDPSRVTAAMNAWRMNTPIRFVERTASNAAQYPNYVTFQSHPSACASSVGMHTGQQVVHLTDRCLTGETIHEIGHALGLWHEQSREDRDNHVQIRWENIMDGYAHNFQKQTTSGGDHFAYDFDSIMHYGTHYFSKNGQPTIVPLGGGRASEIASR